MASADVLIVGGGLAGLVALRALQDAGVDSLLLEGRSLRCHQTKGVTPRLGGRILTKKEGAGHFDLGPAWFWPPHREVFELAREFGLKYFEQFEDGKAVLERSSRVHTIPNPQEDSQSFRLEGGTGALIEGLQSKIDKARVLLGRKVTSITEKEDGLEVLASTEGAEERFTAHRVIVALPPRLALHGVKFSPSLPEPMVKAIHRTPTWMGSAMKVTVGYANDPSKAPFWRQRKLAGYGISDKGPCQQIHDHCSGEGPNMGCHALFGWVDEDHPWKKLPEAKRKEEVLEQLVRLFGKEASQNISFYDEHDWKADPFTRHPAEPEDRLSHHPRYGDKDLQLAALNGKVFLAGTETARVHGGFLAGAIHSGREVAAKVLQGLGQEGVVSL